MKIPLFIAWRYLFAKKSHNIINIISGISVAGIALASFALVCTLSVFNGFHDLVSSLFTKFDPELKIIASNNAPFSIIEERIEELQQLPTVENISFSLEEQALIQYRERQAIVTLKGVEESIYSHSGLEDILVGNGIFMLSDAVCQYGIPGIGVIAQLGCGIQPTEALRIYVPKRSRGVNILNAAANFNSRSIYSPGVAFQVNQQKYDDNYLLVSLSLAQDITGYSNQATAMEVTLKDGVPIRGAKREISAILGEGFRILDRYEQQEDIFKVVKLEKLISYIFLSFILLIASFNIISSLIMLMIEKQGDIETLSSLGATYKMRSSIFIYEGVLISTLGAITGITLGSLFTLLQQWFGFIPLGTSGGFVVDAYPVHLYLTDLLLILVTVLVVSYISIRPINRIASRFLSVKLRR